ncbi:MAG: hypothetical protein M0R46_07290 [Candidatus Muirbacterium halophilum]|nr:hypothetical protein [Candidatus Muirbacterium halophilum]MCK9475704.1 hypothetical protein [Candidatus Muirbacterium halophilum]
MLDTISKYTFISLFKKKSYSLIVFFLLFNLLSYIYINTLSEHFVWEIFIGINLSFLSFLVFFFLVLWIYSEIGVDLKEKRIYLLLGRGISKQKYFIGKIKGIFLTLSLNLLIIFLLLFFESVVFDGLKLAFIYVFISYLLKFFVWISIISGIFLVFSFIKGFFLSYFLFFYTVVLNISTNTQYIFLKKISGFLIPDSNFYSEIIRAYISGKHIPFTYIIYILIFSFLYSFLIINIFSYFFERKEI